MFASETKGHLRKSAGSSDRFPGQVPLQGQGLRLTRAPQGPTVPSEILGSPFQS